MATPIPGNRARFTIDEVVRATRGTLVHVGAANEIVGLVTDSRAVAMGSGFVALKGETHDGHQFVEMAVARDASLVVVERGRAAEILGAGGGDDVLSLEKTGHASVVEVDDTLVAWGDLARAHLARWRKLAVDPRVIAITGSAGKTTTKEITAALASVLAPTWFTAGNLNNRIGVPAVVFGLDPTHRFAVLEMGMSLPGELDAIASLAPPDVAIVTNVGVAHAEGVGGREGVMREKGAVYRALGEDGVAIVNADDEYAMRAAEPTRGRKVLFGRSKKADYRLARRDALGAEGSLVRIATKDRDLTVKIPLPGEAAAIDLVAAIAAVEAAAEIELDAGQIEAALGTIRLEGRATVRLLPRGIVLLDDSYNANPQSMRAALGTLREVAGERRKVAVLGEMKELGALARDEHAALGDAIADAGVDLVIGCGGLVDLALERAEKRGALVVRAGTTEAAAAEAASRLRENDAVLVKASRSVGAERVTAALAKAAESLPSS